MVGWVDRKLVRGSWTGSFLPWFRCFSIYFNFSKHLLLDVPSGSVTFDFFSFVMSFRLRHNRNHTVRDHVYDIMGIVCVGLAASTYGLYIGNFAFHEMFEPDFLPGFILLERNTLRGLLRLRDF